MKGKILWLTIAISLFQSASALADTITGTIQTVNVNLETGSVYVQLTGAVTMNGGGCPHYWTRNLTSEVDFMKYVYPLLLAAKASGTPVMMLLNGCTGVNPKIVSVDFEPRLIN